jgi:hypothetical protein
MGDVTGALWAAGCGVRRAAPAHQHPWTSHCRRFGTYLLGTAIALDTMHAGHLPDIDPKTATGQQARDNMADRQARIWPGLTE